MDTQTLLYISLAAAGLNILGLIFLLFKVYKLDRVRKEFFASDLDKDLEQVLVEQNRTINKLRTDLGNLTDKTQDLTKINLSNFQKIGYVRFNPFDDAGGNMSFAISLLNGHDDGVVISSLHGREGTRMYAKSIKNGKSESKLTDEELTAIKEAK